jgi:hypothetical protein
VLKSWGTRPERRASVECYGPRDERASLAKIHIENRIEEHPQGRFVEDVVRAILRDFAGRWHVLIRQAQTDPWWVVLLEREGKLEHEGGTVRRTLLLDPTG